jgi:hypothetical protein
MSKEEFLMPNISVSKMGFPGNIYAWHITNCGFVTPVHTVSS